MPRLWKDGLFVPFSMIELRINLTTEQFLGEGCPGVSMTRRVETPVLFS